MIIALSIALAIAILYIVADKILLKLSQYGGFTIRFEAIDEE
jgi:hypothetical protein